MQARIHRCTVYVLSVSVCLHVSGRRQVVGVLLVVQILLGFVACLSSFFACLPSLFSSQVCFLSFSLVLRAQQNPMHMWVVLAQPCFGTGFRVLFLSKLQWLPQVLHHGSNARWSIVIAASSRLSMSLSCSKFSSSHKSMMIHTLTGVTKGHRGHIKTSHLLTPADEDGDSMHTGMKMPRVGRHGITNWMKLGWNKNPVHKKYWFVKTCGQKL